MSFQSISRVTVCWAVTSSGPNAEYIDIAQDVQDYIGICDELQESCLCLTSDADKFGVHILALVPTDHNVREAGRFSTAAATTGNVCTIKLINLNAVDFVYRTAGSHCTLKAQALGLAQHITNGN